MAPRVWDAYLSEQDKVHLAASRPKANYGFGSKAAVLAIDNFRAALGDDRTPLLEAIAKWPSSTGPAGWEALDRVGELLAAARTAGLPIIHTTELLPESTGIPNWGSRRKGPNPRDQSPEELERYGRRYDFVEPAVPLPGEIVVRKAAPSAFFGTSLAAYIMGAHIDTLIVCGESASGCVRATVVDGCSYHLRMILVEECIYDRHEAARAINLFDMNQKYGDVIGLAEALEWIKLNGSSEARKGDEAF